MDAERAMRDPDFTLATGPAGVYPRVLTALSQPVTHYYDPVFLERFRRTEAKVGQVFGTANEIILLQGEAVLGLEAAVRSLVRPGMPVLNLVSGIYGQGMSLWLKSSGAQLHELSVTYDEAIDPDEVEAYLDAHPEIELLCVVHCETPSGTLNDCSRISPIARAHGVLTLVDCVASLGGMPLDPGDRCSVDLRRGAAAGIAGLALVRDDLQQLPRRPAVRVRAMVPDQPD
jgi:pyridoxamine---pyruvate transaminase